MTRLFREISLDGTTRWLETACCAALKLFHKGVEKHEFGVSLPNTNHVYGR